MSSVKLFFFVTAIVGCILARVNAGYMTDAVRQVGLNAHNTLRSKVALGQAVNKNGSTLPTATNMFKMSWSLMVEGYAQQLADSCNFAHNSVNGTSNNLYVTGSTKFGSPSVALNASVYNWYDELRTDGQDSLTLSSSNYNHFTQVVWAKTSEIGCAVANCTTMTGVNFGPGFVYTFVVCDYSPAGNYLGQNIYNPGSPASACASNSVANPSTGLCEIQGVSEIHA